MQTLVQIFVSMIFIGGGGTLMLMGINIMWTRVLQ